MLAKTIRYLLLLITIAIVLWSFGDVAARQWRLHRARSEKPINLTVMHWGPPEEQQINKDLIARYEQLHPNVRITRIGVPEPAAFLNKLKTMFAAGDPPDVFYLNPGQLKELAEADLICSFDEFASTLPKEWLDDFFPDLLNAFRYDVKTRKEGVGTLYGFPKDFSTTVFYINVDLFEEAGIDWRDIQEHGWTWDRFEVETKKIRGLSELPKYKNAGREIYGSMLQLWPDSIRDLFWTFGADFFAKDKDGDWDFTRTALDTPEAQAAMQFVARVRLQDRTSLNPIGIAKDGGQEFWVGNIGCRGPLGRWLAPQLKQLTKFRWDVVPKPHAANAKPASMAYYNGWSVATASRYKEQAFQVAAFMCGREGQIQMARDGLAIPSLKSVAFSDDFLKPQIGSDGKRMPAHRTQTYLDELPGMRIQTLPREKEWDQIVTLRVNRAIATGQDSPAVAAKRLQEDWSRELNSPLRQHQWSRMPWRWIVSMFVAVLACAVALVWHRTRRMPLGAIDAATERAGWLFITPWLVGFLMFALGPMIVSLLLSAAQWGGLSAITQANYVSTANYAQLFTADTSFYQSLKVTAYYSLLSVPVFQIAALAVAMLMNSRVRGIAIFRTIYFVPSVVSGVAMAVLWLQLFNNEYGLINEMLRPIAKLFHTAPPNWFGVDTSDPNHPVNDAARWAVPAFVIMSLWGVGGGMIIYLAGLKGIPNTLYEAARIDGAGSVKRFWHITLPMLSPLIFFNLVMGIIGSFQVFTQAYTISGPGPDDATLFYVYQLYRQAFEFHNMGYASAMAWVLFVVILLLTLLVFRGSRGLVHYEGLR